MDNGRGPSASRSSQPMLHGGHIQSGQAMAVARNEPMDEPATADQPELEAAA